MRKTCPGCHTKFWSRGGVVRVKGWDNEWKDFPVCKECAKTMDVIAAAGEGVPTDGKD